MLGFRPLFRGCFLFKNVNRAVKFLTSEAFPPPLSGMFFIQALHCNLSNTLGKHKSFRPLFRGCFLFQMPNYCDFTVYMLGKFPSPLSGMFFIFPSLKMSILSGYILIFAAESFHTELLISPDRHYSRFDTTSSGIGADLYFLFSIDNISSAAFRKLCSRFSHIDPTHNNSIFYRLSIIFSFN